jgi:hypothetical protein
MKLEFSSVEEVKEFVAQLKGSQGRRGAKGDAEEGASTNQTPAPVMPPAAPSTGFGSAPSQFSSGFPGAGAGHAPASSPEVTELVRRVNAKIDGAVASGQPTDAVLGWFRQRCEGVGGAAATLDQIKAVYLPKLSIAHLEETAKLMGA